MNKMKELLENAGFEVSKEEEKKQKTKSEEEILREKARKGEILDFEELIKLGFEDENCSFLPRCTKNSVSFSYYGSELSVIQIGDEYIEDIFDIPEPRGIDDELQYHISEEALMFAYRKAGII